MNDTAAWALMSPATFAHYTTGGKYFLSEHILKINDALMRVERGEIKRLIISMPPRHGKSFLCSQHFPPWYLIRNPDRRVILAAYEADFAATWGRKGRDLIGQYGMSLGGVKVSGASSAADRWDIVGGGGMVCAGVGGALTGKGAHVFIIDDPVKNAEEAHSSTMRERIWEWYLSVAYTRLESDPEGAMIIVMTRWHEDDLVGRILAQEGDKWHQIVMPALSDAGDPLFPQRFDRMRLEQIRESVGSYYWNALYQQRPSPASGDIIRQEWLRICEPVALVNGVRFWDLAVSIRDSADEHAGALCGYVGDNFVIGDMVHGRMAYPDLRRRIIETAHRDGTDTVIAIEEAGQQRGFIDDLLRDPALSPFTIKAVRPHGDKLNRALPWISRAELGAVYLCRGAWNKQFIEQCSAFTANDSHRHDDMIDAVSGAYQTISRSATALSARIAL